MTKEAIFDIWSPPGGLWAPWVKPVLFAAMDRMPAEWPATVAAWDAAWAPVAEEGTVIVIDLPGATGVAAGLALAARGYRPVPLYNAVPSPVDPVMVAEQLVSHIAAVDVWPIACALRENAEKLRATAIPFSAPPAFLLDSNRRGAAQLEHRTTFDNRSISFPTDFPSATFLHAQGIRRAVLVQESGDAPQADLAHTLRRWQEGGVEIFLKRLDTPGSAQLCVIERPPRFKALWYRVLSAMGLHRSRLGGYGGSLIGSGGGG